MVSGGAWGQYETRSSEQRPKPRSPRKKTQNREGTTHHARRCTFGDAIHLLPHQQSKLPTRKPNSLIASRDPKRKRSAALRHHAIAPTIGGGWTHVWHVLLLRRHRQSALHREHFSIRYTGLGLRLAAQQEHRARLRRPHRAKPRPGPSCSLIRMQGSFRWRAVHRLLC